MADLKLPTPYVARPVRSAADEIERAGAQFNTAIQQTVQVGYDLRKARTLVETERAALLKAEREEAFHRDADSIERITLEGVRRQFGDDAANAVAQDFKDQDGKDIPDLPTYRISDKLYDVVSRRDTADAAALIGDPRMRAKYAAAQGADDAALRTRFALAQQVKERRSVSMLAVDTAQQHLNAGREDDALRVISEIPDQELRERSLLAFPDAKREAYVRRNKNPQGTAEERKTKLLTLQAEIMADPAELPEGHALRRVPTPEQKETWLDQISRSLAAIDKEQYEQRLRASDDYVQSLRDKARELFGVPPDQVVSTAQLRQFMAIPAVEDAFQDTLQGLEGKDYDQRMDWWKQRRDGLEEGFDYPLYAAMNSPGNAKYYGRLSEAEMRATYWSFPEPVWREMMGKWEQAQKGDPSKAEANERRVQRLLDGPFDAWLKTEGIDKVSFEAERAKGFLLDAYRTQFGPGMEFNEGEALRLVEDTLRAGPPGWLSDGMTAKQLLKDELSRYRAKSLKDRNPRLRLSDVAADLKKNEERIEKIREIWGKDVPMEQIAPSQVSRIIDIVTVPEIRDRALDMRVRDLRTDKNPNPVRNVSEEALIKYAVWKLSPNAATESYAEQNAEAERAMKREQVNAGAEAEEARQDAEAAAQKAAARKAEADRAEFLRQNPDVRVAEEAHDDIVKAVRQRWRSSPAGSEALAQARKEVDSATPGDAKIKAQARLSRLEEQGGTPSVKVMEMATEVVRAEYDRLWRAQAAGKLTKEDKKRFFTIDNRISINKIIDFAINGGK